MIWIEPDESNAGEEFLDVRAMEFIPHNYETPNFEANFFPVHESQCWNLNADSLFSVYGYPTDMRTVDYEIPHIGLKQIVTSARYVSASSSAGVHSIAMTRTNKFDSDGLSGGSVFHLAHNRNGFFAGFAGLILRGSATSDFLHFIEVRQLISFFRFAMANRNRPTAK